MNVYRTVTLLTLFSLLIVTSIILMDLVNINKYLGLTKSYDWLSFLGAFLGSFFGGIFTFLGVYMTIEHHKKSDRETQRLSNIPILEYKIKYNKDDFDNSQGQLADEDGISHINLEGASYQDCEGSLEWHFNLIISNVGIGHAQISSLKMIFGDNSMNNIEEHEFGFTYKLVKKESSSSIKFLIYAPKKRFVKSKNEENEFLYSLKLVLKYQDLLQNEYEQTLHGGVAVSRIQGKSILDNDATFASLHYYENFELIK